MSLSAGIFEATSSAQASLPIEAGDLFLRDGKVVAVLRAEGEVAWLEADGAEKSGSLEAFKERALERLDLGSLQASFLDSLWQLASSREVPGQIRARAVQVASARARTEEERQLARQWAARLFGGMEPQRS